MLRYQSCHRNMIELIIEINDEGEVAFNKTLPKILWQSCLLLSEHLQNVNDVNVSIQFFFQHALKLPITLKILDTNNGFISGKKYAYHLIKWHLRIYTFCIILLDVEYHNKHIYNLHQEFLTCIMYLILKKRYALFLNARHNQ